MRKLAFILTLIVLASMFIPQHEVLADKYSNAIGVKHVIGNNTDVTYTGKHWTEKGQEKYEYVARIQQAPIYNDDGSRVDCSWYGAGDSYSIGNNVFAVQVKGASISTTYQGQTLSWNPVVLVDAKEYDAKGNQQVLAVDPINSNYQSNTLEWDYGVCVRRVRVIEGMVQETWIFKENPKGTVWIRDNMEKSVGFTWAIAPYAYDANDNPLVINEYKQVMASEFDRVEKEGGYPVTIDPTEVYVTSASDGHASSSKNTYAAAWGAASADSVYAGAAQFSIGQLKQINSLVYRAYVYFDTSDIPDAAVISAVNLSLYGKTDVTITGDFNITVTNGMPTYPSDPLVVGDYDKTKYTGIGSVGYGTVGFTTS